MSGSVISLVPNFWITSKLVTVELEDSENSPIDGLKSFKSARRGTPNWKYNTSSFWAWNAIHDSGDLEVRSW